MIPDKDDLSTMSELTEVIAEAHQLIQRLSALAGGATDGTARSLLSDLELQIARVETKVARLKQENIELQRRILGQGEVENSKRRVMPGRSLPPRPDVRETMQLVSQFYQLFSREQPYRKAG